MDGEGGGKGSTTYSNGQVRRLVKEVSVVLTAHRCDFLFVVYFGYRLLSQRSRQKPSWVVLTRVVVQSHNRDHGFESGERSSVFDAGREDLAACW